MPAFLAPLFTKIGLQILMWAAIVGSVLAALYSIRRGGVLAERAEQISRVQKSTNIRVKIEDEVSRTAPNLVHDELQREWRRD
jgi:hypothetical protein